MAHPASRIVMHADLDCFFAAVEERENPSLKGKPVIVGSDPKGGEGRGIVATCNYAARKFGLRSAMPISIAYRRCPRGVYLRPRFSLYSRASRGVMEILRRNADVFEQAGIDEAYLDVSKRGTYEAALALARRLQREIRESEGLSVSFGIGPNKLIAKIASDHRKPGGVTTVIDKRIAEFLDPKSVSALRGVGPKTKERLAELGADTVAHLRAWPEARLVQEFGKFGAFLWREARGVDDRPVDPSRETKSIGRETTFEKDTDDAAAVREALRDCVRDVHHGLINENLWCRTLTVKVRYEGYETHSRQTTAKLPIGELPLLEQAALRLAEPFFGAGRRFRLIGFSASRFESPADLLPLRLSSR